MDCPIPLQFEESFYNSSWFRRRLPKKDFGIKRTNKPFSRQPIDLTLEQTINAYAARTLTGIAHLTNSISARQRWARSHDIRSTIITHVLEEIGITKKQDISTELQPHNIKKVVINLKSL
ncbi:uncharacterized protein TNCV_4805311 [Trichonephila clavipes]|nr:uncharacterized protein TNCV_4805311 [Trichonephila clavipes]